MDENYFLKIEFIKMEEQVIFIHNSQLEYSIFIKIIEDNMLFADVYLEINSCFNLFRLIRIQ